MFIHSPPLSRSVVRIDCGSRWAQRRSAVRGFRCLPCVSCRRRRLFGDSSGPILIAFRGRGRSASSFACTHDKLTNPSSYRFSSPTLSSTPLLSITQTHTSIVATIRIEYFSGTIPTIDISGFLDGSDKMAVAAKVGQACQEIGFFMIRGHGER